LLQPPELPVSHRPLFTCEDDVTRSTSQRVIIGTILLAASPRFVPVALAQGTFSLSDVPLRYGWNFQEPGIPEDVPKSIFGFENTAAGRVWSSYLFVDVLRSWSDADANAKEVYGEWYPSLSFRTLTGKERSPGVVRDVSLTLGLNTGVRSTGPAPFVLLPGVTVEVNLPGFEFFSLGARAYIDRGRFQGQPTDCHATTYQITPAWSLPIDVGSSTLKVIGFVDFTGAHANCEAQVLTTPRVVLDVSAFWKKPGDLYVGFDWVYWHNKYGIAGLEDNLLLPAVMWVM
jgi:nucleoside-specific outer membrane channel protein Tsx